MNQFSLLLQVHKITIKGNGGHKRNKIATPSISTTITGKLFLKYELFDINEEDDSLEKYHWHEFCMLLEVIDFLVTQPLKFNSFCYPIFLGANDFVKIV